MSTREHTYPAVFTLASAGKYIKLSFEAPRFMLCPVLAGSK